MRPPPPPQTVKWFENYLTLVDLNLNLSYPINVLNVRFYETPTFANFLIGRRSGRLVWMWNLSIFAHPVFNTKLCLVSCYFKNSHVHKSFVYHQLGAFKLMKWVIGTNLNLKERTILYLSYSEFLQLQTIQALPNKFRFILESDKN